MKKILLSLFALASLSFADIYATKCASCHGANGETAAMGKSKIIKDMTKADFIAAMNGYKDGSYGGPLKGLMKGQVTSLSDADIQALADKIAQ
ncbi:MAG: c-type cytochrome [Sulfurimonadaceae bacterium]|jgi:cytochrome c553|nr:c-type cytochrome [Arcobacteraceae bacterium]MDX9796110.1 c-type cytochrome [Arcobacteraceae bacterium]